MVKAKPSCGTNEPLRMLPKARSVEAEAPNPKLYVSPTLGVLVGVIVTAVYISSALVPVPALVSTNPNPLGTAELMPVVARVLKSWVYAVVPKLMGVMVVGVWTWAPASPGSNSSSPARKRDVVCRRKTGQRLVSALWAMGKVFFMRMRWSWFG